MVQQRFGVAPLPPGGEVEGGVEVRERRAPGSGFARSARVVLGRPWVRVRWGEARRDERLGNLGADAAAARRQAGHVGERRVGERQK